MIKPSVGILICINTMIAAGLFINPSPLTNLAGPLGFMGYLISAILLFPLLLCIAELSRLHPVSGGLYAFGKAHVNEAAGFLSGWGYFIGKTTSAALLMHKFVQFFQSNIPALAIYSTLLIDYALIFALVILNIIGMRVGGRAQYIFTALKGFPILFAFGAGFVFFDTTFFLVEPTHVSNIWWTIPIAVFPLLGFEIICAIGHMIEDSKNNIKRVIITAFLIVVIVDILFQGAIFGSLGSSLIGMNQPMLELGFKAFPAHELVARIINGSVFAAILGACFSILTSNCWNLYTLAQNNHIPFGSFFTRVTKTNVPWVCLIAEALLGCIILVISSDQVSLQYMAVFAQIISFIVSAFAAFYAVRTVADFRLARWIPVLGIATSCFILCLSLQRLITYGISFSFISLFLVGIFAALWQKMAKRFI